MQLSVATYNIQHGRIHPLYLETQQETVDAVRMAEVIREMDVSVCGLNEVYDRVPGLGNQAQIIGEHLNWHHAFTEAISLSRGGLYGNALVSAHPIVALRSVPIVTRPEERGPEKHYENRVLLIATLDVNGTEVTVMSCHFGLNPLEADRATETVLREAEAIRTPLIFMGDLNLTPEHPNIRKLAEFFTDSATVGDGNRFTFPSHAPVKKIDYIFAKNCEIIASDVPEKVCSDHLPVRATVRL